MHERGARPWLGSTAVTPPELVAAAGGGEGLGTSALAGDQGAAAAAAAMGDGAGAAESAAAAAVASTTRRRPLIYVYDLPPAYNSRLLQYRNEKCEGAEGRDGGQRPDYGWRGWLAATWHEGNGCKHGARQWQQVSGMVPSQQSCDISQSGLPMRARALSIYARTHPLVRPAQGSVHMAWLRLWQPHGAGGMDVRPGGAAARAHAAERAQVRVPTYQL